MLFCYSTVQKTEQEDNRREQNKKRCCSVVLLFCCSVVLLFCCSVVLLFCSSVLLFFCCSVLLFFCCSDNWCCDAIGLVHKKEQEEVLFCYSDNRKYLVQTRGVVMLFRIAVHKKRKKRSLLFQKDA